MTKHSNFAPSAAERWLNCPASISLSASAVRLYDANKSSPFASAGTAAHAVAALCFTAYRNPLWGLSCETADDPELAEAILPYVAAVVEDLEDPSACAYVESKLHWIADSRLFGTPDAIVASDFEKTVTDYKHGQFTFCAADSAQLQIYGFLASSPSTERLTLRVVQPRYISRHPIVREHVITDVPAWRAAFGARIETAIKAVDETPGKCNPGPHCIWCKGSPTVEISSRVTMYSLVRFSPSKRISLMIFPSALSWFSWAEAEGVRTLNKKKKRNTNSGSLPGTL